MAEETEEDARLIEDNEDEDEDEGFYEQQPQEQEQENSQANGKETTEKEEFIAPKAEEAEEFDLQSTIAIKNSQKEAVHNRRILTQIRFLILLPSCLCCYLSIFACICANICSCFFVFFAILIPDKTLALLYSFVIVTALVCCASTTFCLFLVSIRLYLSGLQKTRSFMARREEVIHSFATFSKYFSKFFLNFFFKISENLEISRLPFLKKMSVIPFYIIYIKICILDLDSLCFEFNNKKIFNEKQHNFLF